MSCSIALRRSPKPGALTAATLTIPRMLLTTKVAKASPSTSSAMIRSGRDDLATRLQELEAIHGCLRFFCQPTECMGF